MKAALHLKLLGPPDIRLDGKPVAGRNLTMSLGDLALAAYQR